MASLTNPSIEKLKMLTKVRKLDVYENISRQQLGGIHIIRISRETWSKS